MFSIAWLQPVQKRLSLRRGGRPRFPFLEPLESRLLLNAGELDVVFNNTGMAASSLGAGDDQVHALVVQEDEALIGSDKIKPLVADFDRVWGDRVSRRREVLEIVQEQAP